MKIIISLILIFITYNSLIGQTTFTNYTTLNTGSNGLLDNRITSFAYGPDGKIWIVTYEGLSHFDGNNWTYTNFEEFYSGLSSAIKLFTDSDNNLWINCFSNYLGNLLLKYDGDSIISYGPTQGYYGQAIESNLYEDIDGNIYIQNPNNLFKFQNDSFYYISTPPSYPHNLAKDAYGKLVISANGNTYRENDEGGWDEISSNSFLQIVTTSDSLTWLGAQTWFRLFHGDTLIKQFEVDNIPNVNIGFDAYNFPNAIIDYQNNIWTHPWGKKGLIKFDGHDTTYSYYNSDNSGFISNIFKDELKVDNGNIWFASPTCGIEEWDGTQFNHINTLDGLVHNTIKTIVILQDTILFGTENGYTKLINNLWNSNLYSTDYTYVDGYIVNDYYQLNYGNDLIATSNYGLLISNFFYTDFYFIDASIVPITNTYKILEGFDSDFWFAHTNGLAHFIGDSSQWLFSPYWENLTTADGLPNDTVYDLAKDSTGNIWLATQNGIASFQNNTFTVYSTSQGLINNQTRSIYVDNIDNIWIGTIAGLSMFSGTQWLSYTTQDGLAGNLVNAIFQDSQGNIWFGTNAGLTKLSNQIFTSYTTADGLSNNYVNSITEDNNGNLWIGTNFGASKLNLYQGIEENNINNTITLFPNPATNQIQISSKELINTIEIYNMAGCLVQKMQCNSKQQIINVSSLQAGSYFVRTSGGNGVWVKKVVVISF